MPVDQQKVDAYNPVKGILQTQHAFAQELGFADNYIAETLTTAGVEPVSMSGKKKVFRLRDVYRALYGRFTQNTEKMTPRERKTHYDAELRLLLLKQRSGDLLEVDRVHERVGEIVSMFLDSLLILPDELERDHGLSIEAVNMVEERITVLRNNLSRKMEELAGDLSGEAKGAIKSSDTRNND